MIQIKYLVVLISVVFVTSYLVAAEEITITTYYPSPYGVYKQLRMYPTDDFVPGAACTKPGEMYFDNSDQHLYICKGPGASTLQPITSYWTASGNDIYNNNSGYVRVGDNVPGGSPSAELYAIASGNSNGGIYASANGALSAGVFGNCRNFGVDCYGVVGEGRYGVYGVARGGIVNSTALYGHGQSTNVSTGIAAFGTMYGGYFGIMADSGAVISPGAQAGHFVGDVEVVGSIIQRGSTIHPDFVFNSDYRLESIEEHSKFMWKNRHLKAVPRVDKDASGKYVVEIGVMNAGILEELEKAHIYIEKLNQRLKELEREVKTSKNKK